jgi:putative transcriptional regulator
MTTGSMKGRLLVAAPGLSDPNFARTVVLLLEHSDAGALGLVLNRPSDTGVGEALPEWAPLAAHPPVVFVGGPVAPATAVCLGRARADAPTAGWEPVLDRVGTVDLNGHPADLFPPVDEVRVFAGYAGWAGGQLEAEIAGGGWFVVDAEPDDALFPLPERLWPAVLRRQGGHLALLANFPLDPSLN